jgi:hypothetical protein
VATLAGDIVQAAYREGNLIPPGTQASAAEVSEGLTLLNRLIESFFGLEIGEPLVDWPAPSPQRTAPVAANYPQWPRFDQSAPGQPGQLNNAAFVWPYPPQNSRIVWGRVTATVYFPENPNPGARMGVVAGTGLGDGGLPGSVLTLDANGHTVDGAGTLSLVDPVSTVTWHYWEHTGDWTRYTPLAALTTPMVFPSSFDDFWACSLAIRLASRYGKVTAQETILTAKRGLVKLKTHYRQTNPTVYGALDFPPSGQSFRGGGPFWGY